MVFGTVFSLLSPFLVFTLVPDSVAPWIVLALLVSRGRDPSTAVRRAVVALIALALSYHAGRTVLALAIGPSNLLGLVPTLLTALVVWSSVGVGFGLALRHVGRDDRTGRLVTAAAVGVVAGEVVLSSMLLSVVEPVHAALGAVVAGVVLALGCRTPRDVGTVLGAAVLFTVPGAVSSRLPFLLSAWLNTGEVPFVTAGFF
ncbi:hypothetical protein [Saccharomonospora iraqiensis]|uniref:hypothetical protein n=1 Tax=Saccharomonospora iraqiensis TaxID=52698 RepID=UPI00048BF63D|nr:hypothetical protein [Saccharomonospora iraqiensis]